MRRINPTTIRLVLLLLIGLYWAGAIQEKQENIQMLKRMEIYEVSFSYVKALRQTEVYYMMCDPPNDRGSIQENANRFLNEGNTMDALRARSKEMVSELCIAQEENLLLEGMCITFLKPSKDLRIGEFPEDIYDAEYRTGEHRLFTVLVTFTGREQYEVEYFWPRKST